MDAFFKGLGKKAGETYKKSRWLYDSLLGTEAEGIASEYNLGHKMAEEITAESELVEIEFIDVLYKHLAAWINTPHRFTCSVIRSKDVTGSPFGVWKWYSPVLWSMCPDWESVLPGWAETGNQTKGSIPEYR